MFGYFYAELVSSAPINTEGKLTFTLKANSERNGVMSNKVAVEMSLNHHKNNQLGMIQRLFRQMDQEQ
jgi:hypothetical protein